MPGAGLKVLPNASKAASRSISLKSLEGRQGLPSHLIDPGHHRSAEELDQKPDPGHELRALEMDPRQVIHDQVMAVLYALLVGRLRAVLVRGAEGACARLFRRLIRRRAEF